MLGIMGDFSAWIIGIYEPKNPKYLAWRVKVEANKAGWLAFLNSGGKEALGKLLRDQVAGDELHGRNVNNPAINIDVFCRMLAGNEFTCDLCHAPLYPGSGTFLSVSPDRPDNNYGHTVFNTVPIARLLNSSSTTLPGVSCWWPKKLVWVMLNSRFFTHTLMVQEKSFLQSYHDSLPGPSS